MRHILLTILFFLLVGGPATAATPTLEGSWRYAGGEQELDAMKQAVDETVAEMNFFMRPIAKPRLRTECQPWKTVAIERDGESVTVTYNGNPLTSPIGRTITTKDSEGNDLRVTRKMKGEVLFEKLATDRGGRTNAFRRTKTGIVVDSTIFSSQLPDPVEFTYTYR